MQREQKKKSRGEEKRGSVNVDEARRRRRRRRRALTGTTFGVCEMGEEGVECKVEAGALGHVAGA